MTIYQTDKEYKEMRNSGIELLKIIAIILIVIFHVVYTLSSENMNVSYSDYVIDVSTASKNLKDLCLVFFRYFGAWGNDIFFICSAWFLLRSSKYSKTKWFGMLFETWVISIIIAIIALFIMYGDIPSKRLVRCMFPTTFSNNWYITCYLIFYPIHPLLNLIINKMDKRRLLRSTIALLVINYGFYFLRDDFFFCNHITLWIATYFVMAYLQIHLEDFMNSTKQNIVLLLIGLIGLLGLIIISNTLGLYVSYFSDKVLHWTNDKNPFLLVISIAMFNLMRKKTFKSRVINYISSLSFLIYIIHDNIILREYFRPYMWNYVCSNYGYDNIIVWVFVLALLVLAFGLILSIIYDKTIRSVIRKIGDKLFELIRNLYLKLETKIVGKNGEI